MKSMYVQSILHGQVNLAAVNQIYVIYEAMNSCKYLKIHLRLANILTYMLISNIQTYCEEQLNGRENVKIMLIILQNHLIY